MSKKIKLVIDSVIEDRIRILTTTEEDEKKTMDIAFQALLKILKRSKRIVEGRSYLITFENNDDYEIVASEQINKEFKPKGKIKVKDTTKKEKDVIQELQRKLGLKI